VRDYVAHLHAPALAAVLAGAILGLTACAATPPKEPPPLKLVDVHTHMMVENLSPDAEVALLKQAGIDRVVMMHTEPVALDALAKRHPGFVIPSLGLTRMAGPGLRLDAKSGATMEKAYRDGGACAFGEIPSPFFGENADVNALYAAAVSTGAPLLWHLDLAQPETVAMLERALTANPKMTLILGHLGWTAGPELIGRLLDAHPNLYTEVSIRFDAPRPVPSGANGADLSILAPDGAIQPAWRAVMARHSDRFLFGMDINSFGPRYLMTADLVKTGQKALDGLPRPLAEAIAHRNAERLLKGCGGGPR
jgi:hypothetical protein